MGLILIADDDQNLRYSFQRMLEGKGYSFVEASDGQEAVARVQRDQPDVVVMDVRMPRMDGLAAFEEIKRLDPGLPVIIMTAFGSTEVAIEAMKRGAFDYTLKPFNVDEMCAMLERALKVAGQRSGAERLPPDQPPARPNQIVGSSRAMQRVYKAIGQVAESDVHVLIQGESGTGKELVAWAVHEHSQRASKPFIPINCAAIPENLIESELFGHERGAFTGAVDRQSGLLQAAEGGTVYLDEILELPPPAQAKLLRFLQEGEVIRLGSNAPIKLDVRVIASSNTDLREAVARRRFREDLLFRLNAMSITLPPLRDRLEDLAELVAHFVNRYNARHGKGFTQISAQVIKELRAHSWPGNVRELENMIHKAVIVGQGEVLLVEHLYPETFALADRTPATPAAEQAEDELQVLVDRLIDACQRQSELALMPTLERLVVTRVLEQVQGNQVQAARLLGISRNTLRNRIERFDLQKDVRVRAGGKEGEEP
jgi:DNA-binding NtrC family response regulator